MIYRFYTLGRGGRIVRPPETLDLSDDAAAVAHGRDLVAAGAHGIEIWTGARLVKQISPQDDQGRTEV
jgi:hypothetical protein